MAMYSRPERCAAATISSIEFAPSVQVVCDLQVAAQRSRLDQARQAAGLAQLDLAGVLAQLGRDVGEPERGVDLLLGAAGDGALAVEDAVLVELVALLDGDAAQRDVVVLASR